MLSSAPPLMNGAKLAESKKDLPPKSEREGEQQQQQQQASARSTQRVLLLLTALPLGLAAFAFLTSGPPFEDDASMPGWADRQGQNRPVNDSLQALLAHCPNRPRNANFMFPYRPWHASLKTLDAPRICICTTTAAGLDQILPWLYYHRTIGVEMFIIFVEGRAAEPEAATVLETIPGVKVVPRTKELDYRQAHSRVWNETWLSFFFYKPCNYELFVRQSLNMEVAIDMAREAKMDWISHVDTDELLYPAGAEEFSLQRLLGDAPLDADTVIFPNYETAIESDDIKDPFAEISMYKKNFDHVSREVYFQHYKDATKGNPNYYLTYGNGKSAARMVDHLRSNGAHRFHNYARAVKEHKFPEAAVLHYTYTRFSDLTSRRDRCGCKPNKEDVKRCFMLDFDRQAFIVASTQTEEQMREWYRQHVVWTDKEMNEKLLKKGLFGRIHTPQVIVRGIQSSGIINATIKNGHELLRKRKAEARAKARAAASGGASVLGGRGSRRGDASRANTQEAEGAGAGAFGAGKRRGGSEEELWEGLSGAAQGQGQGSEGVKGGSSEGTGTSGAIDLQEGAKQTRSDAGGKGGGEGRGTPAAEEGAGKDGVAAQRRRRRLLSFEEYMGGWWEQEGMAVPPLPGPGKESEL